MKLITALLALMLLSPLQLFAQDNEEKERDWKKDWKVDGEQWEQWPTSTVEFETDEGTWMNLDVSPDGRHIVFDMLGNIYLMPATGGNATPVREGVAYEIQPRFSPDGQWISFTSDIGGGDNIWIMRKDGSDARQITNESFRLMNNAVWSPEGDYIIAKKHFSSTRSLGAGELWMYHLSGGTGIQLVEKPNDQQDLGQPFVSPDGRYVYYSQDVYPGGFFQYNKDPNSQIYAINRYDRETGERNRITGGAGGAISPTISPDGKKMAFVRRVRTQSVLFLRDLETGREYPVYDQMSKDQQEAWAIFGPYTNMNWMPNSRDIVFYANGKIRKLNTETRQIEIIPFRVNVKQTIAEAVHFEFDPSPENFDAKAIRHAVTSPDGSMMVFNAAGFLWKKDLPNGTPQRLTEENNLEFEPSFSADGSRLVWVTWSDVDMGAIKSLRLDRRRARVETLTSEMGIYREPRFSPDGNKIVYRRESGNNHQGYIHTLHPGIYIMNADGSNKREVNRSGSDARFNATGDRLFYLGGSYLGRQYRSMDLNGNDHRTHFKSTYANNFVPSPDNKWVAFNELFKVYIAPMPLAGTDITLSANTKAIPVTHVAQDAGSSLHWSGDSQKLHWTLGDAYFSVPLKEAFDFLRDGQDGELELPLGLSEGKNIGLELKTDKPTGVIAIRNALIITMNGDEVIQNGDVVIRNNRIEAVGPAGSVEIPSGAREIDASGKTVMPGMVDAHAHIGNFREGLSPQQQWHYFANLAYGVTTVHDPSSNTEMIFSQSEMVRAGYMVGPRIFSTGRILYGAEGDFKAVINSLEDARSAIRRTQAYGATSVKSYNQPRRDQRQQVLQAARELGVNVVPEGGSTFTHNMNMIIDGHTGIEHNIPIYPIYKDVLTLWGNTNVGYTPTHVVNYGSMSGEYYWYQNTNVWESERLLNFTPRSTVDSRSRHRTMIPHEEYEIGHIESATKSAQLLREGVTVNIGGHGQVQGLAAHWEMWIFEQGGMSSLEAIRSATINPAKYIGMGDHLGSIEPGKLADMLIIDGNVLDNIRHSENIVYTIMNGRVFDAMSMNEVISRDKQRLPFWWEQHGYDDSFDFHAITDGEGEGRCSCGRQ